MSKKLQFFGFLFFFSILFFYSCKKDNFRNNSVRVNKPPFANAGKDTIIVLPLDSLLLDGSASNDPDGNLTEFLWSKISGPLSFTFDNFKSAKNKVKNLDHGLYKFELKVTDNGGLFTRDTVMITVDSVTTANHPPIANAGPDQIITLPASTATLDASGSVDPDDNIAAYQWSKISGPTSFIIANANAEQTNLSSLVEGIYQFELIVSDSSGLSAKDSITVTVNAGSSTNRPPIANAGEDQIINLPDNAATLDGSQSADPDNTIAAYQWKKISGPASMNILNVFSVQTLVTSLVEGIYVFELQVTDQEGLSAKDTVLISVNAVFACGNNRPEVTTRLVHLGNLSKPRSYMAVASAANRIVFAGGLSSDEPYGSSRVDIYDIASQTWSIAELSEARFSITAVAAGNKIFFAGGESGELGDALYTYHSTVDIYDVATNTWSVTYLSEPQLGIAATAVGNKVFFAGGNTWTNTYTNKVEIYDISTNSWSTKVLSESKVGISAISLGNKIYLAGGENSSINYYSDRIDIYDNTSNSWSTSTLSEATTFLGGIAVANKIYWAGGRSNHGTMCKVEVRDLNTQTTSFEHLSKPAYVRALLKDNKIMYYGNDLKFDLYDLNSNTWSVGVMPANKTFTSVSSANNTIYLAGGYMNGSYDLSDEVWILEF